ncbi:hypothetical protein C7G42_29420 [Bradyrhizobium sp. MOS003]|nr:hypothetical protein C7G42_29420 [Bradyrhizobium sp. MOS003]
METIRCLRAMASLCRQTSARHPDRSWKLLAEAEFWSPPLRRLLGPGQHRCARDSRDDRRRDLVEHWTIAFSSDRLHRPKI